MTNQGRAVGAAQRYDSSDKNMLTSEVLGLTVRADDRLSFQRAIRYQAANRLAVAASGAADLDRRVRRYLIEDGSRRRTCDDRCTRVLMDITA